MGTALAVVGRGRNEDARRYGFFAAAMTAAALVSLVDCGSSHWNSDAVGRVRRSVGSAGLRRSVRPGDPADLLDRDRRREWSAMEAEFNNLAALESGADFAVYHPVVFHLGSETVTDAAIKLHGQSSWVQTVMFDGDARQDAVRHLVRPERSERQVSRRRASWCSTCRAPTGRSCTIGWRTPGCGRSGSWPAARPARGWRSTAATTASSSSRRTSAKRVIEQFFPRNADGDLWKGGEQPETNKAAPDWARLTAF